MKTKQWKKAAALMSAGAMTASVFAAPLAVKADDKVTISFSFDQGVGEATQKMVDAYNESQDKVEVQTVILPQDANTVHDDFVNKLASGDTSVDVMGLDVTYAWLFVHPVRIAAITGTMNADRIQTAVDATELELSYDEWYQILEASRGYAVP